MRRAMFGIDGTRVCNALAKKVSRPLGMRRALIDAVGIIKDRRRGHWVTRHAPRCRAQDVATRGPVIATRRHPQRESESSEKIAQSDCPGSCSRHTHAAAAFDAALCSFRGRRWQEGSAGKWAQRDVECLHGFLWFSIVSYGAFVVICGVLMDF